LPQTGPHVRPAPVQCRAPGGAKNDEERLPECRANGPGPAHERNGFPMGSNNANFQRGHRRLRSFDLSGPERLAMAERLRTTRWLAGLTMRAVASGVGVNYASVEHWEHGALPRPQHRAALAKLYGADEVVLFSEVEEKVARARAMLTPVAMVVIAGGAEHRVALSADKDLRGVMAALARWCRQVEVRLDQIEFRLECLDGDLRAHEKEKAAPAGWAHAETTPVHVDADGLGGVEELVDNSTDGRVAELGRRLDAVAQAFRAPR
jgi:transcriptional regulator with XRE-family HTH domain